MTNGRLPPLPPGALFAVREAVDDLHHGLADRKAIGHSNALKHLLERAEEAGVSRQQREHMASEGFQRIFEDLTPPKRRNWGWRFRRERALNADRTLRLGPG